MRASTSEIVSHGGRPSAFARRAGFSALCAALFVLVLPTASAFASRTFEGQLTGFSRPTGLTVDPADNVWVADPGKEGLIKEFDPSGSVISTQNGSGAFEGCFGNQLFEESLSVGLPGDLFVAAGPQCSFGGIYHFDPGGAEDKSEGHFELSGTFGFESLAFSEVDGARLYATTPGSLGYFDRLGNYVNFTATAPYIDEDQIVGTPAGGFGDLGKVAVDSSGNIYVTDQGRHVVDEFAPSGEFVREFIETGVPGGLSGQLGGLAIDPTTGDLLVVDRGNDVVDEFGPTGTFVSQITGKSGSEPFAGLGAGIGVNSAGKLYVVDGAAGIVDVFGPSSTTPATAKVVGESQVPSGPNTAELAAEVNPSGSSISDCHFEYGISLPLTGSAPCEPNAAAFPGDSTNHRVSAEIQELVGHVEYHYRVAVTNQSGTSHGPLEPLETPDPELPAALGGSASEVSATGAMLTASVNPGFGRTVFRFEYGVGQSIGQSYGFQTLFASVPESDGSPHSVSSDITGLSPATVYHFRLKAVNFSGIAYGPDETFTTPGPPGIVSASVSEVSQTAATLFAAVIPDGAPTTMHFEYGPTAAYGSRTSDTGPFNGQNAPSSTSQRISGLQPGATYHFRAVGENAVGQTLGPDQTFTTVPVPAAHSEPAPHSTSCRRGLVRKHGHCVRKPHVTKRHHQRGRNA